MAAEGPVGGVEQLHGAVGVASDDLHLAVGQDAQRRAPAGDLEGADRGKALARGVEELGGVEDSRAIDREAAGDQNVAALEEDGPVRLTRNAKPPGQEGQAPRNRVVDLRCPLRVAGRDQDTAVRQRRRGVAGARDVQDRVRHDLGAGRRGERRPGQEAEDCYQPRQRGAGRAAKGRAVSFPCASHKDLLVVAGEPGSRNDAAWAGTLGARNLAPVGLMRGRKNNCDASGPRQEEVNRAPPSRASSRAARVACRSHSDLVREHPWGKTYAMGCEEARAANTITRSSSNDQESLRYAQGSVGVSVGPTTK